jgi:hypothetical protein
MNRSRIVKEQAAELARKVVEGSFNDDFAKADQATHKVEDEWHYPIFTKYGYEPLTKEAKGFVRQYKYTHPKSGHSMTCHTGAHCDYWTDKEHRCDPHKCYWADLEPHLKSITGQS